MAHTIASRQMRQLVLLALIALLAALSGCATNLYQYGRYEQSLYEKYKDPSQAEAMRLYLTEHISALEKSKITVPPGLYAELGTLHLEGGDSKTAIRYYELERSTWPESNTLMTALITNLQRLEKKQ